MFGYINVDKSLNDGAKGLNQTFMCGLCISTKRLLGNKARMIVNNDINFYNVLLNSYCEIDVEIYHSRCLAHPLKKRTIVTPNNVTDKLSLANMMLMYYNLYDDVIDGSASLKKKLAVSFYTKQYKKARKQWKEMDELISSSYNELRKFEQSNESSIDRVSDSFATLSARVAMMVVGEHNQMLYDLCYNVGKWIYLIDALDDLKEDFSQGSYNVFIAGYKAESIEQLLSNIKEIEFILYTTLNAMALNYNDLNLTKYKCVLDSVIYHYVRNRTKEVIDKYQIKE